MVLTCKEGYLLHIKSSSTNSSIKRKVHLFCFLRLADTKDQSRSVKKLPETITALLECPSPCKQPPCPVYSGFRLFAANQLPITVNLQDVAWLFACSFTRYRQVNVVAHEDREINQLNQMSRTPERESLCGQHTTPLSVTKCMPQRSECHH